MITKETILEMLTLKELNKMRERELAENWAKGLKENGNIKLWNKLRRKNQ